MGERIGRIETDFWELYSQNPSKKTRKIRLNPPDPPNPFSHCITTLLRFRIEKGLILRIQTIDYQSFESLKSILSQSQ
jgi:hypothetical protein